MQKFIFTFTYLKILFVAMRCTSEGSQMNLKHEDAAYVLSDLEAVRNIKLTIDTLSGRACVQNIFLADKSSMRNGCGSWFAILHVKLFQHTNVIIVLAY